ncbi:tetratricopeptide repeat protein [Idiomarina sp. HP20-50]|uniref:YfgM family protein n=1 Tax=Idiomarina sp. HP20-50 TaxID=3070813 RepID=UPI00294AA681|nr:tetratricopeptide repeat protein [Idiomarina sp. HP20-50]MDV6315761.1 tetratricopeptide repeat protein [Idiomarina sp. HP20-50]
MDSTEEQQVERLKEFWKEHGKGIVAGVVIGFGLFYGWRYYDQHTIETQQQASANYEQLTAGLSEGSDNALQNAQQFVKENPENIYAHLVALQLAEYATNKDDLATAVTALQSVVDNSDDKNMSALASIRLARVLIAQDQLDMALSLVQKPLPEAYTGFAAELEGDILAEQGNTEEARAAYERALQAGESLTPALQMKLNSLAKS